jgi:hypothetical protein
VPALQVCLGVGIETLESDEYSAVLMGEKTHDVWEKLRKTQRECYQISA